MARIVWDALSDRRFASGLDRGVLYTRDGEAHAWNGLTAVTEKQNRSSSPVYFDGVKAYDQVTIGAYSATLSAFTYPEVLDDLAGRREFRPGFYLGDQVSKPFSLCYRTMLQTPTTMNAKGAYKLHVLYDVMAYPSDVNYQSLAALATPVTFQWEITSTPRKLGNSRPAGYFEIDGTRIDPLLLTILERQLYGTSTTDPSLPTPPDIGALYDLFYRVRIIDNLDGTWTARIPHEEDEWALTFDPLDEGKFMLDLVTIVSEIGDEITITDTKIDPEIGPE